MASKTYRSAVVIIPPLEVCKAIQAIRADYDKQFRRWMPHINLLYPFKPIESFENYKNLFSDVCAKFHPFTIRFSEFCFFQHHSSRYSIWLAPKPKETLIQLQSMLLHLVPECNDVNKNPNGFHPHLTVAQAADQSSMISLRKKFQSTWQALEFEAKSISLIHRNDPPNDIFEIITEVSLGKPWNLTQPNNKRIDIKLG